MSPMHFVELDLLKRAERGVHRNTLLRGTHQSFGIGFVFIGIHPEQFDLVAGVQVHKDGGHFVVFFVGQDMIDDDGESGGQDADDETGALHGWIDGIFCDAVLFFCTN